MPEPEENSRLPITGFTIYTVVDRLTLDMLRLLPNTLGQQNFYIPDKHASSKENEFCANLWLILNKFPYSNQLLFRDYSRQEDELYVYWPFENGELRKIHRQAFVYVERVIVTQLLQLANVLGPAPGNMHLLLAKLYHYGTPATSWNGLSVMRQNPQSNDCTGIQEEFQKKKLEVACEVLKPSYSKVAQRRSSEYGDLRLVLEHCSLPVPQEMSFLWMLRILPLPIAAGFVADTDLQKFLNRVLSALNERYTSLRCCGLDPNEYYECDRSIGDLKGICQLRKRTENILATEGGDRHRVYERVFNEMCGDNISFGGYSDFLDFWESEIGRKIVGTPILSLEQMIGEEDDDHGMMLKDFLLSGQLSPEDVVVGTERRNLIEKLIISNPKIFSNDPVMTYFFRYALGEGTPVYEDKPDGEGEPCGLLDDSEFINLIRDHSQCARFLNRRKKDKLRNCLNREAVMIVLIIANPEPFSADPVMTYFFHHALGRGIPVCEDEPGGLLDDPEFIKLVKDNPNYAYLTRKRLAQLLWLKASEIIKKGIEKC